MTILEKKEQLINLRAQLKEILEKGQKEGRQLNETELSSMADLKGQIDGLDAEIKAAEEENREINKNNKNNKKTMETRFVDVVNGVINNNLTDEVRSLYQVKGNTFSTRGIQASVATAGQEAIAEDKMGLELAIRNASVLNKIGARWFSNAQGSISIPKYAGSSVGFKGEVAAADDGKGTFSEVILSPRRLCAFVDVSKEFLSQTPSEVEGILVSDLAAAVAEHLDKTVFSDGEGDANTPAGLLKGDYMTTGNTLASVTYDNVLALEEKVEEHNGTDFIFIANPKVKYALKGTQTASGLDMVFDGKEIDGYETVVSNSVKSKGILCVDPKDIVVAMWGMDITVDAASQAVNGNVRLVVNAYVDCKLRGDRIAGEIFE